MKFKNAAIFIVSVLACQLAGLIGSVFTTPAIRGWYTTIEKSPLNPPNWIFGPVWTLLFTLMGISLALIWISEKGALRSNAIKIFSFQLILNTLWSIIFFGLKNPALAFLEIVVLWFAILYTIIVFRKINKTSAWLLVPYILWVSFASYLNLSVALLN